MFGITDLGVFVAGTVAIVLLPGPTSLYVLTVATRAGLRMGYAGALGIVTGWPLYTSPSPRDRQKARTPSAS